MNEKGRGKELKLELFNNYNVLIGTVDNRNTVAVYLKISAWVEPTQDDEEINYSPIIKKLDKSIRSYTYKNLDINNFHNDLTIIDLDIRESGIAFKKRSFMSCELTLFQKANFAINSDFMIDELSNISKKLVDDIFEPNEYFKFYQKKK